ncbi:hypothetical protein EYF80_019511 [Liparis tanakae]|uniref:Uncharacterized protein n=1 Tax=Liparis tanakae TaxID=230148 RepID=A0A4Z2HX82_9TELE|nr:hypothetical protein EYF80_019511 [Liparis tanakae]
MVHRLVVLRQQVQIICGHANGLWGLDFRWSPRSDVAVAPRQLLFTVDLCAETGGVAPVVPGEEGACLGGEEGGLLCRCGGFEDRTTANTVCVLRER